MNRSKNFSGMSSAVCVTRRREIRRSYVLLLFYGHIVGADFAMVQREAVGTHHQQARDGDATRTMIGSAPAL